MEEKFELQAIELVQMRQERDSLGKQVVELLAIVSGSEKVSLLTELCANILNFMYMCFIDTREEPIVRMRAHI